MKTLSLRKFSDRHLVRNAVVNEWIKKMDEVKHDRDIWRERAERAESLLKPDLGNDVGGHSDSNVAEV